MSEDKSVNNTASDNNDNQNPVESFKKVVEKSGEYQRDLMKQVSNIQQDTVQNMFTMMRGLTMYNAMFKTTVQSGGRISIPEAERQALDIQEGDLVQVIVIPIDKKRRTEK